ncbi:AMP-binding protein [Chloroflexota bacterium]
MNLRTFWENKVQKNREKIFLYYEDEKISYSEFDIRVNQVANGLIEKGIRKGDRICLMLPNTPEFLYSWFGLGKMGGIMVPINTSFKANETKYIVNHSEAAGLIVHKDYLQIALEIRKDCPHLKWIICVDSDELPDEVISYDQLSGNMPKELKHIDLKDDDLAAVIYTSGTTGFPKGAMHVHGNFTMTGEAFLLTVQLSSEDRLMVILPLYHLNAQFYSTMGAIAAEASLILIKRFSASKFWEQAVRYGATEFNFIGAVGRILCARPDEEFRPEHTIRVTYGAGITPDVYETFTKRFKIPFVIDGYGLTEVPRVCQNPIGGMIKMNSMGLPARHPDPSVTFSQMKVIDEDGKEAPPGKTGELVVRSPVMMEGYFKDPQKTREAIRDGWFHTVDYVYKDKDGYYFFVDRKEGIIRRRGENISSREVENVINGNQKVLETAVIAVPSELGEDEVMACIVVKPNQSMSAEEVIDWCKDRLANFKIPRFIQFRKDLPKTPTQGILKIVLKEEASTMEQVHNMAPYKKSSGLE